MLDHVEIRWHLAEFDVCLLLESFGAEFPTEVEKWAVPNHGGFILPVVTTRLSGSVIQFVNSCLSCVCSAKGYTLTVGTLALYLKISPDLFGYGVSVVLQ